MNPEALQHAVRSAAEGTPYVVDETDYGFELRLDLADAQWWGIFNRAGLRTSFAHEVRVKGDRFVITDVAREIEWIAGTPRIAASGTVERGRIMKVGFQKTYAFDDNLRPAKVVDHSYRSETGRKIIEDAATGLGLKQAMPMEQKIAMAVAGLTLAGLLIGGLLVLVLWIAGVI